MKLVLSESQYNRIFNNKKRKMVVTESQYNRLLNESDLSNNFSKIKKFDIIKIDMDDSRHSTLHFRVMYINSNEIIMINCNNGVYKNAYFYINKSGYSGDSLKYKIAQDKAIDIEVSDGKVSKKNLIDTLGNSKLWRSSTFNNITNVDVYVDGEQDCNLSDNAKKKLSVVDDKSKDDSEGESKPEGKVDSMTSVISTLNQIKPNYKYNITIGDYKENSKKNKEGKIANNIKDGNVIIHVTARGGKTVDFEVLSVEGESGNIYKHLVGKDSTFIIDKKSITIDEESKAVFKMFTLDIETFKGENEGGVRAKEDDAIANIMQFVVVGPYDKDKDYKEVEEDDEEVGLTKAEIKKAVEDDDILKDMIQKRPVKFMEFVSSSIFRKKGIIPSQEIFSKWGADNREGGKFPNLSEGDEIVFKFEGKAEEIGTRTDEELDKLKKFISAVKNKGDEFEGKVGRYKPGAKYISILCKELDGIYYRLRLYEDKSSGSDDVVEVRIAFYDSENYNKGNEIAKDKIKIIKNKSKKK